MTKAALEHVNITVSDPVKTGQMLVDLFDWKIRWQGPSMHGGFTVHVGTDDQYIAVYGQASATKPDHQNAERGVRKIGSLNHVCILVDDLDAIEQKILAAGYTTESHGDYEPGRRYYFYDHDGIEFEIVSYT